MQNRATRLLLTTLMLASALLSQGLTSGQKSKVRNATFYLDSAERSLRLLAQRDEAGRGQARERITKALRSAGSALGGLPNGNAKIDALRARFDTAKRKLSSAATATNAVATSALKTDLETLRRIEKTVGQSTSVTSYPERFVLFGERWNDLQRDVAAIAKKHSTARQQRSGSGWELERLYQSLRRRMESVERAARDYCKSQPAQLTSRLTRMEEFVEGAVAKNNHRVFDSYVRRELQSQTQGLAILDAWGHDTKALRTRLREARTRMTALEERVATRRIAQNKLPADRYRCNDRDALLRRARTAWTTAHPKDEIVAIRIPDASWNRDRRIRYSSTGGFWLEDRSSLQIRVVIAEDAKTLLNGGVMLVRDHEKGGSIRATALPKTKTPSFRILRSKLLRR